MIISSFQVLRMLSNVLNVIYSIARLHKSSYVLHSPIKGRLDGDQVLSGFRLDLIVKPFPLLGIYNLCPCSARDRPIVAAYSCHMFSTRNTECLLHSGLGATEDFLDENSLPRGYSHAVVVH